MPLSLQPVQEQDTPSAMYRLSWAQGASAHAQLPNAVADRYTDGTGLCGQSCRAPIDLRLLHAQRAGGGAVLCGDPRQLGPVVRSPLAALRGLAVSLLERFIDYHAMHAELYISKVST